MPLRCWSARGTAATVPKPGFGLGLLSRNLVALVWNSRHPYRKTPFPTASLAKNVAVFSTNDSVRMFSRESHRENVASRTPGASTPLCLCNRYWTKDNRTKSRMKRRARKSCQHELDDLPLGKPLNLLRSLPPSTSFLFS